MLDRFGSVLPFGVILAGDAADVKTYFPKDKHPNASWEELVNLVESELRARVSVPETRAVAAVVEMQSGKDRAIAVQAETRSAATLLMYPIKKKLLGGWKIGDPSQGDNLLLDRLLSTPQQ